ncbi:hypothetical protein [Marinobacter salsuginis]|uniref:hypothetical protein n=1 Tax=Marinobacter salsuginis TaxID=418719 RepID=UPI001ADF9E02|nr:hypothetical protein [Marinobacter salsuginis]QTN40726.1 hypothetical protein HZ997_13625 [Marinobacter salsuginis]
MKQFLPSVVLTVSLSPYLAAETNKLPEGFTEPTFSYTQIGFQYGYIDLKEEIPTPDGTYEKLGAVEFAGSYQIAQNLFIGAQFNRAAENKQRSEVEVSSSALLLGMPLDASENVDLVPTIGLGEFKAEVCSDNRCFSDSDTAAVLGAELRVFAIPDTMELKLGLHDNTLEGSDPYYTIGLAGWAMRQHRLSLEYTDAEGIRGYGLGYSFNW